MEEMDSKEIGCIVIPKGKDKEKIINLCFNEERFYVMTNRKGLLSNVPCIHQVINDIEFPSDENSLGSQVIVEYISAYDQYIITGTLSKVYNSSYQNEGDFLCKKTYKGKEGEGNTLGMIGNNLLSKLSIFCKNLSRKAAYLYIECFGNKDSELNLNSSGWVLINTESGFKLRYKTEKEISILDDKIQILFKENQKLVIKDKEFIYEDGTNTLKIDKSGYYFGNIEIPTFLTEIIDFLGNDAMLLTSCGPSSVGMYSTSAAPKLNNLKQKILQINKK